MVDQDLNNNYIIPLEINVLIGEKNEKPSIELRRMTTNPDIIKNIVSCAFHGKPIIIIPTFNDRLRSISNLIEKGIIYKEEEQYYFTF